MVIMLTVLTYQSIADLYSCHKLLFMFLRQERLALLLLIGVTIAVIASHLILSTVGKGPFSVPYTAASEDGELVVLSGTIDHLRVTRTGDHLLMQVNNTSVFIPGTTAQHLRLQNGNTVSLVGIVQTYEGTKEVVVQAPSDISLLP
jgi:DNA/RNA endonuclease YhcR with UshA esterase domain